MTENYLDIQDSVFLWDPKKVSRYVSSVLANDPEATAISIKFIDHNIDGPLLSLLSTQHLKEMDIIPLRTRLILKRAFSSLFPSLPDTTSMNASTGGYENISISTQYCLEALSLSCHLMKEVIAEMGNSSITDPEYVNRRGKDIRAKIEPLLLSRLGLAVSLESDTTSGSVKIAALLSTISSDHSKDPFPDQNPPSTPQSSNIGPLHNTVALLVAPVSLMIDDKGGPAFPRELTRFSVGTLVSTGVGQLVHRHDIGTSIETSQSLDEWKNSTGDYFGDAGKPPPITVGVSFGTSVLDAGNKNLQQRSLSMESVSSHSRHPSLRTNASGPNLHRTESSGSKRSFSSLETPTLDPLYSSSQGSSLRPKALDSSTPLSLALMIPHLSRHTSSALSSGEIQRPNVLSKPDGASPQQPSSPAPPSSNEPLKQLRASTDDSCLKVLQSAMKRHHILREDWSKYVLVICYGDKERILKLVEKPVVVFKELQELGQRPAIMLRQLADEDADPEGSGLTFKDSRLRDEIPGGVL